jgi:hypothetical protein
VLVAALLTSAPGAAVPGAIAATTKPCTLESKLSPDWVYHGNGKRYVRVDLLYVSKDKAADTITYDAIAKVRDTVRGYALCTATVYVNRKPRTMKVENGRTAKRRITIPQDATTALVATARRVVRR